jgi:hypothetical protein
MPVLRVQTSLQRLVKAQKIREITVHKYETIAAARRKSKR